MIWYNERLKEYSQTRPQRVRLNDNTTITNDEITNELLEITGWKEIELQYIRNEIIEINSGTNTVQTTTEIL